MSPGDLKVGIFTPYVGLTPDPNILAGAACAGPAEAETGSDTIGILTAADSVVDAADEVFAMAFGIESQATYDADGTDDTPVFPEPAE